MDDSFRLQTELANAESRIAAIERILAPISELLRGTGHQVIQTPSGIEGFNRQWMVPAMPLGDVPADGAAGVQSTGAFFRTFQQDGHTFLQGGSVTGGNGGSATIPDIKILDAATGVGSLSGKRLYLKANCTATVQDGIMLPGCLLNSAECSSTGTTTAGDIPSNHSFTVADATGDIHTEIGRWTATGFLPSAPGNILASGCIGNFSLTRA